MKRLVILATIILIATTLSAFQFDAGVMVNTDNESDNLHYIITTSFFWKNHAEIMGTYEKEAGNTYISYNIKGEQSWKYFSLVTRHVSTEKINKVYVEGLGRYPIEQNITDFILIKLLSDGYWELGYRQQWDHEIPSSNIVFRKSYQKEMKSFFIPLQFKYSISYNSSDWESWEKEIYTRASFSVVTNLDFYLKYLLEKNWTHFSAGITIKL